MTAFTAIDKAFHDANALEGPLRDRLTALQHVLERVSPEVDQAYEKLVDRLQRNLSGSSAPGVGDVMPNFLLPNDTGGLTGLTELLDAGPIVISFNRGHWCHHCMLELFSLARIVPRIQKLGAQVVSVVPERQRFSRELKSRCQLPFPVLSDIDNAFGLSIGLVFPIGDELRDLYKENNLDLAEFHGCESWLLPIPATFVVGQSGHVQAKFTDPDFRQRMEPDAVIAALEHLERGLAGA